MAAGKGYKASDRIRIEHPKTGESYGVTGAAFAQTYERLGFRAVSFENGAPFSLTKAEQDAASRAAAPSSVNVGPAGPDPTPAPAPGTRSSGSRKRSRPKAKAAPTSPAPASSELAPASGPAEG